jgi:hypothetical protein
MWNVEKTDSCLKILCFVVAVFGTLYFPSIHGVLHSQLLYHFAICNHCAAMIDVEGFLLHVASSGVYI